jgi:hypothetical protein
MHAIARPHMRNFAASAERSVTNKDSLWVHRARIVSRVKTKSKQKHAKPTMPNTYVTYTHTYMYRTYNEPRSFLFQSKRRFCPRIREPQIPVSFPNHFLAFVIDDAHRILARALQPKYASLHVRVHGNVLILVQFVRGFGFIPNLLILYELFGF